MKVLSLTMWAGEGHKENNQNDYHLKTTGHTDLIFQVHTYIPWHWRI